MRRMGLLGWVVGVCLLGAVGAQAQRPRASGAAGEEAGPARRPVSAEPEAPSQAAAALPAQAAEAVVPRLVKFSGLLRDLAGKPLTGPVDVSFLLYKEEAGGEPLWFETQTVEADAEGRYTVLLGAMHGEGLPMELFSSNEARWLGIQVGNLPEQPRVLLVSVPYALKAADAEKLGGKPASSFVQTEPEKGAEKGAQGTAGGTAAEAAAATGQGAKKTAPGLKVSPKATAVAANNIPVFTDNAGTLGSSVMAQSAGGNIGLGTTTPGTLAGATFGTVGLHVKGTGGSKYILVDDSNSVGFLMNDSSQAADNRLWGFANQASKFTISAYSDAGTATDRVAVTRSGNVGIGTTTPGALPGATFGTVGLHVKGNGGSKYILVDDNNSVGFLMDDSSQTANNRLWGIANQASNFIIASYSDAADPTSRVTVTRSGNVGIGTAAPGVLLQVAGDFKVAGTNGGLTVLTSPSTPNMIGGFSGNSLTSGVVGATIGGGGATSNLNTVTDDFGTVCGGENNRAGDNAGTTSDRILATVGGGSSNTASGFHSTVAGGSTNTASGSESTVAGGHGNTASGDSSTVTGGLLNTASGVRSFAAGFRATAVHDGAFIWADNNNFNISSTGADQFIARATGGVKFISAIDGTGAATAGVTLAAGGGAWASISDRASKEHFGPVDGRALLAKLNAIPIETWNYKAQSPAIHHLGPVAQDFYQAFGLGEDDKHITTLDAEGVALAAAQALYRLSLEKDGQFRELRQQGRELKQQNRKLTAKVERLEKVEQQVATLEARLARWEASQATMRVASARAQRPASQSQAVKGGGVTAGAPSAGSGASR